MAVLAMLTGQTFAEVDIDRQTRLHGQHGQAPRDAALSLGARVLPARGQAAIGGARGRVATTSVCVDALPNGELTHAADRGTG